MGNHEEQADELFNSLKKTDRERMVFRWSYVGNRELGDLIRRMGRVEAVIYGTIIAGILGAIISRGI